MSKLVVPVHQHKEEIMLRFRKLFIPVLVSVLVLSILSLAPAGVSVVQAQAPVVYNLYATDGYTTMADGTKVYIYGFVGGREGQPLNYLDRNGAVITYVDPVDQTNDAPAPTAGAIAAAEAPLAGNAQFPGPVIWAEKGQVVEIRLKNLGVTTKSAPNDPHTIHLHGLDVDAANDGVPETSVAAVPANGRDLGAGNVVVYMFTPEYEGTYMYHCHQEAQIHVQMGMYGALVVYNPGDGAALNGPTTGGGNLYGKWDYDKDYILLLSEFDLGQHKAEERAGAAGGYNSVNYKPQYWFINGLGFPQTIHVNTPGFNYQNWSLAYPGYDPFIQGSITGASGPTKVLLRVINLGFQTQPMHMHGYHAKVVGSDQRDWFWAEAPYGEGLEKNTLTVGSGETYEWIIDFSQQSMATSLYPTGTQSRYDPATNLPVANTDPNFPAIPDPFVPGKAYIGGPVVGPDIQASQGPGGLPPELPFTLGQYFPFHNHDDYKATNNGVYPGGMFTLIHTLP
jgi:FtsP/CotA-like multicopper oxidase with cupredoxin domain